MNKRLVHRTVFADTVYWIARLDRNDALYQAAMDVMKRLPADVSIVTTQAVLFEVLNHFSKYAPFWRQLAVELLEDVYADASISIVDTSESQFFSAVDLYRSRSDKQYSLTDCLSFVVMRARTIDAALTYDAHFTQEGFVALLREG